MEAGVLADSVYPPEQPPPEQWRFRVARGVVLVGLQLEKAVVQASCLPLLSKTRSVPMRVKSPAPCHSLASVRTESAEGKS